MDFVFFLRFLLLRFQFFLYLYAFLTVSLVFLVPCFFLLPGAIPSILPIFVQSFLLFTLLVLRPTLMHTKNLYENGPNPFVFFGTKNMSEGHLMHTVLVCYVFDKLGQACLCG